MATFHPGVPQIFRIVFDDANDALRVNVVAGSTSSTEYTEGDTDSTITGVALLFEDDSPGDTLRVPSATNPLPINITSSDISIGGGTEYTEGDTDTTITGSAIMFESNTGTSELSVVNSTTPLPVDAVQSGTWDINDVSGTVSLPTGAATSANQLPDGHNVTVDNVAGTNPVPIEGNVAIGATLVGENPVPVAFSDFATGNAVIPAGLDIGGGLFVMGATLADTNGNLQFLDGDGSTNVHPGSTDGTLANSEFLNIDSNRNAQIVGSVDHNDVDSGAPIKTGGRARTGTAEPTAVANDDRVDAWFDEHGRLNNYSWSVRKAVQTLTAINDTYNGTTTTNNSADISIVGFRYATFNFSLVSQNTPTRFLIELETKNSDGSTYHTHVSDYFARFVYEDGGTNPEISESVDFELPACDTIRISVTATGTTGSGAGNEFTMSDAEIWLRS